MSGFRVGSWVLGVLVLCTSCAGDRARVAEPSDSPAVTPAEQGDLEQGGLEHEGLDRYGAEQLSKWVPSDSTKSEPGSDRSTIFSGSYWERRAEMVGEDLHQFRMDIDRTIFDLGPREPFSRRPEYPFDTEWSLFEIDAEGQLRVRSD